MSDIAAAESRANPHRLTDAQIFALRWLAKEHGQLIVNGDGRVVSRSLAHAPRTTAATWLRLVALGFVAQGVAPGGSLCITTAGRAAIA